MFLHCNIPAVGIKIVVSGKGTRNIHFSRTRHAVAATCAGNLHLRTDGLHHSVEHAAVFFGQIPRKRIRSAGAVFLNHCNRIHAGKHAGHFRLVPEPLKRPLRRSMLPVRRTIREGSYSSVRQVIDQFSAAKRFHYYYRDALRSCIIKPCPSCLARLVKIIVLDLAEIPVARVYQAAEGV